MKTILLLPLSTLALTATLYGEAPAQSPLPEIPLSGHRVALVIGNNAYPTQPLANAVNDASAIAKALGDSGFETAILTDVTLSQFQGALTALWHRVRPGDFVLFYYAGHGFQLDSENYFVPIDFTASDASTAQSRAIPMSSITDGFKQHQVHSGAVIADACRNNPFSGTRALLPGLAAVAANPGVLVALATLPGSTASDDSNRPHGLYTQALLDNLQRPGVTVTQLFANVTEQVSRESGGQQVPWTESALRGNILVGSTVPPNTPSARPHPVNPVTVGTSRDVVHAPNQPAPPTQNNPIIFGPVPEVTPPPGPPATTNYYNLPPQFFLTSNTVQPPPTGPLPVGKPTRSPAPPPPSLKTVSAVSTLRLLGLTSSDTDSDLNTVSSNLLNGDLPSAEASLALLSPDKSSDYRVVLASARLQALKGQYSEALALTNRALQLAPLNPLPVYLRAICLSVVGQYPDALADIAIGLQASPDDTGFLALQSDIYFVTGHYEESIALCNKLIGLDAKNAVAYLMRGNNERLMGNATAATADYTMAAHLQSAQDR